MEYADALASFVGRTPVLRLERTSSELRCDVFGKLEGFNPVRSILEELRPSARDVLPDAWSSVRLRGRSQAGDKEKMLRCAEDTDVVTRLTESELERLEQQIARAVKCAAGAML